MKTLNVNIIINDSNGDKSSLIISVSKEGNNPEPSDIRKDISDAIKIWENNFSEIEREEYIVRYLHNRGYIVENLLDQYLLIEV